MPRIAPDRRSAKDRQTTLQVLDNGIQAYDTVLKNASRQEDAAYNYEYLVRLRDELLKNVEEPGLQSPPRDPRGPTRRAAGGRRDSAARPSR